MGTENISDISYEKYLNKDKLMGSQCKKCGELYTPPRPICIKCYDTDMELVEMKGDGKLAAFTCISVGPPFMVEEGFDRKNPYCVGVVELEEGTRVDARIEGVDTGKPETIKVGMPVSVHFLHREKNNTQITYLAFKPK